jgi:uncharacterized membrane protein YtjA (UPF0391 family)
MEMLWAPIMLILSLIAALIGFTGIMGEEVMGPARLLFVGFLVLFFGAAFLRKPGDTPTTPTPL